MVYPLTLPCPLQCLVGQGRPPFPPVADQLRAGLAVVQLPGLLAEAFRIKPRGMLDQRS